MTDERKKAVEPPKLYEAPDLDFAIVELGIALVHEAKTATNPDYKFKLINSIVALRGALPPMYAVNQRR